MPETSCWSKVAKICTPMTAPRTTPLSMGQNRRMQSFVWPPWKACQAFDTTTGIEASAMA